MELAGAASAATAWAERLKKVLVRPRSSAGVHAIAVDDPATALTLIAATVGRCRLTVSKLEL
jgi:histone demethylase JARID1